MKQKPKIFYDNTHGCSYLLNNKTSNIHHNLDLNIKEKVAELKACNPSCEFGVIVITSASLQKDLTGTGYWVDHYNVYLDLIKGYKECGSLKYSAFIWAGTEILDIDPNTLEITYGENKTNEYDRIENQLKILRDMLPKYLKDTSCVIMTTNAQLDTSIEENVELNANLTSELKRYAEDPKCVLATYDTTAHVSDKALGIFWYKTR